jgi:alpha-N-arabinofuranosidase
MRLRPEMSSDKGNPGFLGRRQQHAISSATTAMTFAPRAENEKAGLLVFQNESHFYFLCKSVERGRPAIQLYRSAAPTGMLVLIASRTLGEATGTVFLGIRSTGNRYAFSFSMDERHWNLLMDSVDATFLSTKVAGGFVGCMYALYGTSQGKPAANTAYFDWFTYAGEERETKN